MSTEISRDSRAEKRISNSEQGTMNVERRVLVHQPFLGCAVERKHSISFLSFIIRHAVFDILRFYSALIECSRTTYCVPQLAEALRLCQWYLARRPKSDAEPFRSRQRAGVMVRHRLDRPMGSIRIPGVALAATRLS